MVSNPGLYSRFTTGSSLGQILDAADAPHTGLIKALSLGLGQNYAISGFDITVDSASQIDVGAGVIFRDGKRIALCRFHARDRGSEAEGVLGEALTATR